MAQMGLETMTAGGHKKFLFDTDFGFDQQDAPQAKAAHDAATEPMSFMDEEAGDALGEAMPVEETPPPPTFSEDDMARAREEGRAEGRDEATRDLASAMEQRVAAALEAIDTRLAHLLDSYDADMEQHNRDAIVIATVMMRKLFPSLNMDNAIAEIEKMIVEAMQRTSGAPALIVRVPADIHQDVEASAARLAKARGREGVITVLADQTMAPGNVAVEWDGGGMLRDTAFIWGELDEIIERNLGHTPQAASAAATPAPTDNQGVVNPAPVGENVENPTESPASDAGGPGD